jgi:tetratricopeptide (TPR) repeat protein
MKNIKWLLLVVFTCASLPAARSQVLTEISIPPNGDNERSEVSQWIGLVKISLDYHAPNVHGGGGADRTGHIWGGLIPYGFFDDGHGPSHATPWRVGANESTTITFSHDVKIEGHDLKAGTYALFLALEKTGPWTWIFSNHLGWGSYQYDPENDALRVPATAQAAPYTEFMTFLFDERRPNSAVAVLEWENKRISFKIDVPNVNELYVEQIRKELQGWPGFNYQNWQKAAMFCASRKINLEEALVWAEKAIHEPFRGVWSGGREDFSTLRTKAAVLEALGREAEADAVTAKALSFNDTPVIQLYVYGLGLLARGKKDKALEIAELNAQRHPEEKFWTRLGLARAYTALNDKPHAIENWQAALSNVPLSEQSDVPSFENSLNKLKSGN